MELYGHLAPSTIDGYIDNRVTSDACDKIELHLNQCEDCYNKLIVACGMRYDPGVNEAGEKHLSHRELQSKNFNTEQQYHLDHCEFCRERTNFVQILDAVVENSESFVRDNPSKLSEEKVSTERLVPFSAKSEPRRPFAGDSTLQDKLERLKRLQRDDK